VPRGREGGGRGREEGARGREERAADGQGVDTNTAVLEVAVLRAKHEVVIEELELARKELQASNRENVKLDLKVARETTKRMKLDRMLTKERSVRDSVGKSLERSEASLRKKVGLLRDELHVTRNDIAQSKQEFGFSDKHGRVTATTNLHARSLPFAAWAQHTAGPRCDHGKPGFVKDATRSPVAFPDMAPGVEYAYPEDGDGGLDYAEAQDYLADLARGQDGKSGVRMGVGVSRRSSKSSREDISSNASTNGESRREDSSKRNSKRSNRTGGMHSSRSEGTQIGKEGGESESRRERHSRDPENGRDKNFEIDTDRLRSQDRDRERKREDERDRRHEHRKELTSTIADIKKRTQLLNQRRAEPHTQELEP
jgi:hypothetical protein